MFVERAKEIIITIARANAGLRQNIQRKIIITIARADLNFRRLKYRSAL